MTKIKPDIYLKPHILDRNHKTNLTQDKSSFVNHNFSHKIFAKTFITSLFKMTITTHALLIKRDQHKIQKHLTNQNSASFKILTS